jgi:hypothetical protein
VLERSIVVEYVEVVVGLKLHGIKQLSGWHGPPRYQPGLGSMLTSPRAAMEAASVSDILALLYSKLDSRPQTFTAVREQWTMSA